MIITLLKILQFIMQAYQIITSDSTQRQFQWLLVSLYTASKGYNLDKSCQTTFTVSKGVITNVAYKGNDV